MKKCLTVALLLCILCLACTPAPPPPPPTPPPPPPPTPEQIAAEIGSVLAPMKALMEGTGGVGDKGAGAAGGLSDAAKKAVTDGLQQARTKHQATENGKQALAMVTHDLEAIISKARDQKRWRLVLGAIEAYEVLSPANTKMTRIKERAILYMNRPLVYIKGFVDDKETNDIYAFLEVELHPSMEIKQVQVKPGEEFLGVRFLDIIGDRKGIRIEYIAIPGETRDIMTGR